MLIVAARMAIVIRRPAHNAAAVPRAHAHLDIPARIPVPIPVAVVMRGTPGEPKRHDREQREAKCFSPHGSLLKRQRAGATERKKHDPCQNHAHLA